MISYELKDYEAEDTTNTWTERKKMEKGLYNLTYRMEQPTKIYFTQHTKFSQSARKEPKKNVSFLSYLIISFFQSRFNKMTRWLKTLDHPLYYDIKTARS